MNTVFEVYKKACQKLDNIQKDEINVRILLCYVNKYSEMSEFYLKKDQEVRSIDLFNELFSRYLKGEPIQYITNEAYFLGDIFYVDNRVLIPRMETEEVATYAINKAIELFGNSEVEIADICTGSGCLGIELAKHLNCKRLFLTDLSLDALEVARINCEKFMDQLPKYNLRNGDGLSPLYFEKKCNPNIIIANPPYIIDKNAVDKSVLNNEPHLALFTDDNIKIYKDIICDASKFDNDPILLVLEISDEIYPLLKEFINTYCPMWNVEYIKDINNKWRIASIIVTKKK